MWPKPAGGPLQSLAQTLGLRKGEEELQPSCKLLGKMPRASGKPKDGFSPPGDKISSP
jgi:hypothetical protein